MDPEITESPDISRVYISVDVDGDSVIYRRYWERGPERDPVNHIPTDSLAEMLDWAFTNTDDVLVRVDGRGYWRARPTPANLSEGDAELLGEIFLEGGPGRS